MVDFMRFDRVHGNHFNYRMTWPDAYEDAAKTLGGLAGGKAGTMEDSYKRVAKALRDGDYNRFCLSTTSTFKVSTQTNYFLVKK